MSSEVFKRHLKTFTSKYHEMIEFFKEDGIPLEDKLSTYNNVKLLAMKIKNMTNKLPPDYPEHVIDGIEMLHDEIMKMEVPGLIK